MRKVIFLAAMAAMIFASCAKDGGGTQGNGESREGILAIKIVKAANTRVEASVSSDENYLELSDALAHYIFVINNLGAVYGDPTTLIPEEARSEDGQLIEGVPADSKVLILANIPAAGDEVKNKTTLAEIQGYVTAISAVAGTGKDVVLGNSEGPVGIIERTPATGGAKAVYDAAVSLTPLVSRIELSKITGGVNATTEDQIVSFDVVGVYPDDYFKNFYYYYDGIGGTELHEQGINTEFEEVLLKDETLISSVEAVAKPAETPEEGEEPAITNVWGFNLASDGDTTPRLIVALKNVKLLPKDGVAPDDVESLGEETIYFLTVKGFKAGETDITGGLERGKIYRVPNITFNSAHLWSTPNPELVDLYVEVAIGKWSELANIEAELY